MKLWTKSLLAIGVIGATSGVAIGASYVFIKTNSTSSGYRYQSRLSKYTKIDKLGNDLQARVVEHAGDFIDDKIAEVDLKSKKINGQNIDDYFVEYAKKHKGVSPDFVIRVGAMNFDNQYTSAIKPSEFVEFIKWFFQNVSWGPEIVTLTSFSIVRGVENKGGSITLGGHSSQNHETTNIKFYPDAFFGSLPMYSLWAGAGQNSDSMFAPFGKSGTLGDVSKVVENIAPIYNKVMKENMKSYIGKKIHGITVKESDVKNAGYKFVKHLYPVGSGFIDGKKVDKFQAYSHINPGLYDAIAKKYPYHLRKSNGPVIEQNSKGEYKVIAKKHEYMPISERIPMSEILSLNPKFKGYGTSWLHYVSTHEYGHHQTLNSASDFSSDSVLLGAWTKSSGPSFDSSAYNLKNVNMYLKSRANGIQVRGVSAWEVGKPKRDINNYQKGIYAKFSTDNGKSFETNKQIFGTDKEDSFKVFEPKFVLSKEYWFEYFKQALYLLQDFNATKYLNPEEMVLKITKPEDWNKHKSLLDFLIRNKDASVFKNNINITKTYDEEEIKGKVDVRGLVAKSIFKNIYKGRTYLGYLLNAFDNNSGTLSQGLKGPAEVLSNRHFINSKDLPKISNLTDVEKEALNSRVKEYSLSGYNFKNSSGKTVIESAKEKVGKGKFIYDSLSGIFTNYTMTFPEVLTRDFVQITYLPSKEPLMPGFTKHKNSEENISESNTGFELNNKWIKYRTLFRGDTKGLYNSNYYSTMFWEQFKGNSSLATLLKGNEINKKTKDAVKRIAHLYKNKNYYLTLFSSYVSSNETYIGKNLSMANGYFNDRFIRKAMDWSIYKEDGSQEPYVGDMTDLNGKKPMGVADAYWYYLLKSKGVGDRTLTGIWRSKARDALYAYGYVPTSLSKKIKYLALKNKTSGKVEYVQINTKQDNLHYYVNQSSAKIRTLADEGYTSWTTNFFSSGNYSNATAKPGEYTLYFVDSSKNKVDGLTLGSKPLITENGKLSIEAATKIIENENGLVFKVLNQFAK
ncbi:PDxFFG protein [Mycoplasma marinum]|uniref:PDxFFG protein n=1 Tax=Mycoplasma marinum TaxID=1937190 RepID=A0A4R0XTC7_9MOLU|nr:PDxFFG protein [Mycoplasma marinum]TCG11007.1 PDxFFG protein [Mycoplasma marinum]